MNIIAQEVHRQSRKPKEYRKVEVSDVNDIWSMDLVEMQTFEKENTGYRYLLTCIDVFSRYAWVESLKNKTGVEVMNAIKKNLIIPMQNQTKYGLMREVNFIIKM